ncbi:hypothetical protein ABT282_08365 [Streptomyces sp. NPDC000927]|uniref:hypothetical protein n=1 Tax=Streptomyces sp. NPDC000927 TaxID=3154371 RepID=UPI003332E678
MTTKPTFIHDPNPWLAYRDRVAEAIHATSVCEVGNPVSCGGGCVDAADAVLAVQPALTEEARDQGSVNQ